MVKECMRRKAADNPYLHKDFHGALSGGIEYLHRQFGPDAVREYLRQFATEYYAPLKAEIKRRGLIALREHIEKTYAQEGGRVHCSGGQGGEELRVEVPACPAVQHMRAHGYAVAELFYETEKTIYATLCEGTDYAVEWCEYDPVSGRSVQRFYRRAA